MPNNKMPLKKRRIITISALIVIVALSTVLSVYAVNQMQKNGKGVSSVVSVPIILTTKEITNNIIKEMGYTDIKEVEQSQLSKHYVFPEGLIKSATVYTAKSADSAFEIACFELANEKFSNQIDKAISEHMTTKASGFQNISPIEYNHVQNYTAIHNGAFTFVMVGENSDAAKKLFNSYFKK